MSVKQKYEQHDPNPYLGKTTVTQDYEPNIGDTLDFLKQNPPKLTDYEILPAIAVDWSDQDRSEVKTMLTHILGVNPAKLEFLFPSFKINPSTTFWSCDEIIRLALVPKKMYTVRINGKTDYIHIYGGYYLKPINGCLGCPIEDFTATNNCIDWGFVFSYRPNGYFVYPRYLIKDRPILHEMTLTYDEKRRQLKGIKSKHFMRQNDRLLMGQTASLRQITEYCQKNLIQYDSLYAKIGSICSYAFKVLNQEDVEHAIKLSETEGYLCWICASKESADEFDLSEAGA